MLGLLGVKGLAAGLNSLALGLRVDFLMAATRSMPGDAEEGGDADGAERSSTDIGESPPFGTTGGC